MFPGLIDNEDGVVGVFLEGVVAADDVVLRGDEVIVHEELPGAGEVADGLGGEGGGRREECEEETAREGQEARVGVHE